MRSGGVKWAVGGEEGRNEAQKRVLDEGTSTKTQGEKDRADRVKKKRGREGKL